MCVVVVSSKSQLLEVLSAVPAVQALSISSRNMRLWKVRTLQYSTVQYSTVQYSTVQHYWYFSLFVSLTSPHSSFISTYVRFCHACFALPSLPIIYLLPCPSLPFPSLQIDGSKGNRILTDPEVISALAERRSREGEGFVLLQESFTSKQELIDAKKNGNKRYY